MMVCIQGKVGIILAVLYIQIDLLNFPCPFIYCQHLENSLLFHFKKLSLLLIVLYFSF